MSRLYQTTIVVRLFLQIVQVILVKLTFIIFLRNVHYYWNIFENQAIFVILLTCLLYFYLLNTALKLSWSKFKFLEKHYFENYVPKFSFLKLIEIILYFSPIKIMPILLMRPLETPGMVIPLKTATTVTVYQHLSTLAMLRRPRFLW